MDVTCHLSLITLQLSPCLHTSTSAAASLPLVGLSYLLITTAFHSFPWNGDEEKVGKSRESSRVKDGKRWGLRKSEFTGRRKKNTLAPSLIPP